jgi:hypothetical protein
MAETLVFRNAEITNWTGSLTEAGVINRIHFSCPINKNLASALKIRKLVDDLKPGEEDKWKSIALKSAYSISNTEDSVVLLPKDEALAKLILTVGECRELANLTLKQTNSGQVLSFIVTTCDYLTGVHKYMAKLGKAEATLSVRITGEVQMRLSEMQGGGASVEDMKENGVAVSVEP